jgi:hypothetical protein
MNPSVGHLWLRNQPRLLALIVRFNTLDPLSIHPGRAPAWMQEAAMREISATPRGQRRISEALRRWVKLNADGYYDFQPLHRRFALLELPTLERLLSLTGAALLGRRVARIVRRDELREVKQAFGDELFEFALKRGRFLAAGDMDFAPPQMTSDAIKRFGWRQLEACLSGESDELTGRLQLKLPPERSLECSSTDNVPYKAKVAALMRKVLLTEVQPELAPCFE